MRRLAAARTPPRPTANPSSRICQAAHALLRAPLPRHAGQLHLAFLRSRKLGEPPRTRLSLPFLRRNAAQVLVTILCGSPFTYHFLYRFVFNDAFGFFFLYVTISILCRS